jgi:hypothetical protein
MGEKRNVYRLLIGVVFSSTELVSSKRETETEGA